MSNTELFCRKSENLAKRELLITIMEDMRLIGNINLHLKYPEKYNNIFAQTEIDAQNFWVQIGVDIEARRKLSAKVMPHCIVTGKRNPTLTRVTFRKDGNFINKKNLKNVSIQKHKSGNNQIQQILCRRKIRRKNSENNAGHIQKYRRYN